jgi:hypothetical protein
VDLTGTALKMQVLASDPHGYRCRRPSEEEAEVLVMIILGWIVVLPAFVVAALYRRSSAPRIAAQAPVDADVLMGQIKAFATAGRTERTRSTTVAAGRTERPTAAAAARPAAHG